MKLSYKKYRPGNIFATSNGTERYILAQVDYDHDVDDYTMMQWTMISLTDGNRCTDPIVVDTSKGLTKRQWEAIRGSFLQLNYESECIDWID